MIMNLNRHECYCSIRLESMHHSYRIGCSAETGIDAQLILVNTHFNTPRYLTPSM